MTVFKNIGEAFRRFGRRVKAAPLRFVSSVVVMLILIFGAVLMLYPYLWMVGTSFKSSQEVITNFSVYIIPKKFSVEGYKTLGGIINIWTGLKNTAIVLVPQLIFGTIASSMAAFGYAKLKVPCKNFLFLLTISAVMVPYVVTMVPEYMVYVGLNLIDTPVPLILSGLFGNISFMFFVKEYLSGVSDTFFEAAKIDGANTFTQFTHIMIPLCVPAIGVQVIFWFLGIYNDVLGPDIYLHSLDKKTLQVMLKYLDNRSGGGTLKYQPVMMAGAVLTSVPLLVLYALFQKHFMVGVTLGGIKE